MAHLKVKRITFRTEQGLHEVRRGGGGVRSPKNDIRRQNGGIWTDGERRLVNGEGSAIWKD